MKSSTVEARTVEELMTSGPTSIASDAMAVEAARRMLSEDVGSLPVVEEDRLVGMVTDRDLVLQVMAKDLDPSKIPVSELCTEDPVTVEPGEALAAALTADGQGAGAQATGGVRRPARRDPRSGGHRASGGRGVDRQARRGDLF